jgi:hypothetical protein
MNDFYVLQLILQRGDVPENKMKSFKIKFQKICLELQENKIIIKEIEKIEKKITDDPISRINTDALIISFKLLLEKDGKIIEPNNKLLRLPYEFLLNVLVTH